MGDLPAYLITFLAEAIKHLEGAPEHGNPLGPDKSGIHCYLDKVAVVVEGETIGHLVNEDPDWLYRPVPSA